MLANSLYLIKSKKEAAKFAQYVIDKFPNHDVTWENIVLSDCKDDVRFLLAVNRFPGYTTHTAYGLSGIVHPHVQLRYYPIETLEIHVKQLADVSDVILPFHIISVETLLAKGEEPHAVR